LGDFVCWWVIQDDVTLLIAEASHILGSEAHLLDMPQPLPTIEELDHRRNLIGLSRQ